MRRTSALTALIVVLLAFAGPPRATSATDARRHVAIETKTRETTAGREHTGTFTLVALDLDSGKVTGVVTDFSSRRRDGQPQEVIRGTTTLTGRQGTLVLRDVVVGVDAGGGYFALTGTWSVVRGTGKYAGVRGGGRQAGVVLPGAAFKALSRARYEGFLTGP